VVIIHEHPHLPPFINKLILLTPSTITIALIIEPAI